MCNRAFTNILLTQKDDPSQLKRYIEHLLKVPGPKEKILLLFAGAQRLLLETVARANWLGIYAPRLAAAKDRKPPPPVLEVVGAFTEDLDTLDYLFYAGIPVWYVRPPHCIIYTGLANKAERYRSMCSYIHSLLQPVLHLGKYVPPHPVSGITLSQSTVVPHSVAQGHKRHAPCKLFTVHSKSCLMLLYKIKNHSPMSEIHLWNYSVPCVLVQHHLPGMLPFVHWHIFTILFRQMIISTEVIFFHQRSFSYHPPVLLLVRVS